MEKNIDTTGNVLREDNSLDNVKSFWRKLILWFRSKFDKTEPFITASDAYFRVSTGSRTDNVDELIALEVEKINNAIRNKTDYIGRDCRFEDYNLIYEIPHVLAPYANDILKVFEQEGHYTVVDLSKDINRDGNSIKICKENTFLISWYKETL